MDSQAATRKVRLFPYYFWVYSIKQCSYYSGSKLFVLFKAFLGTSFSLMAEDKESLNLGAINSRLTFTSILDPSVNYTNASCVAFCYAWLSVSIIISNCILRLNLVGLIRSIWTWILEETSLDTANMQNDCSVLCLLPAESETHSFLFPSRYVQWA